MATVFEKIIARELPAHFIYEDERCAVILDMFPAVPGQSLVITKEPVDYFFELDDELAAHLLRVSKRVAKALDATFDTVRTCLVIEGLEVPHAHIKLYPITERKLDIAPGPKADDAALAAQAEKIKKALG
jgi:diadenosine tetraphosphate (Ap4A) HIT family hydrolase